MIPTESPEQSPASSTVRGFLLSVVLAFASIPAFSLGFFDPSLAPFALLGVGLLVLAWRSFLVAFPHLRPRFERTNSRNAARRAKREARLANDPNRQWLRLLALIPVALLILFAASLSFPAFGMLGLVEARTRQLDSFNNQPSIALAARRPSAMAHTTKL